MICWLDFNILNTLFNFSTSNQIKSNQIKSNQISADYARNCENTVLMGIKIINNFMRQIVILFCEKFIVIKGICITK